MATFNFPAAPPAPPMVNAGTPSPTSTPLGMADLLRDKVKQSRTAERSRRGQEMWQGLLGQFGPDVTQGPVQNVDWGNIIGKGVSSYMAAKQGKEADVAEDTASQLQQEFFNSVTQGDEQGSRLVQMAQAGIPGADQALAQYLNPKKEALAGMIQGLTTGQLSPEIAAELAPRYGLSPNVASRAAQFAMERREAEMNAEFDQRKELATLGIQGRLDAAQISAEAKAAGKGPDHIPAGTVNQRNKVMFELDDQIQNMQATNYKFDDLTKRVEADENSFSAKWGLTEALGQWDNPMAQFAAKRLMSPLQVELSNVIMDETLDKLARLSGAVSNYEMQQIKAGLPNALLNKEAAIAMMKQLNKWRTDSINALKLKRMYMKTYGFMDQSAEDVDFYSMAKNGVTPEAYGAQLEAQKAQNNRPAQSGSTLQQFMDEAAELGFE